MNYLFTSESVSEGHPDKVADQISDALLDNYLAGDAQSHVACETLVTTGQVVVAGEVTSAANFNTQKVVRKTIQRIGYTKAEYKFDSESCGIFNAIHEQSEDINRGVSRQSIEEQGAGDQGIMFGYACNETSRYMPITLDLSHALLKELADIRREGKQMTYLRPDAKSQVTVEYSEKNEPVRVHTIVISTQHDPGVSMEQIKEDVKNILIPRVKNLDEQYKKVFVDDDYLLYVNPTGSFVIGGPHGDTGLTGRKIIVDTYGGHGAHGGGAFSGKDPSKVDRSAAYAARHIAKNLVAAGVADRCLVQLSYAIGVAQPLSIFVNTYGTSKVQESDAEIAQIVARLWDLRPGIIERDLKLRAPIYEETASYGHVGRMPKTVVKEFVTQDGKTIKKEVELFTWEKIDRQNEIKSAFHLAD